MAPVKKKYLSFHHSRANNGLHKKVEAAMKLGKQFYKDYVFFSERVSETKNDEDLERALVLVQQLGKLYEQRWE